MNISRISIDGLILSIKCLVEKVNYIKSRYCNMENSNNDDKWLCQLMWAIGFVLLVMRPLHVRAMAFVNATIDSKSSTKVVDRPRARTV